MKAKSKYAKIFDSSSHQWEASLECNKIFLNAQANYATDLLKCRGYVFLNEVYDLLGLPRTKAGQIVGWRYGGELSDNKVCFDIRKVRGKNAFALDFNVDGDITDLLED